MQEEDLTEAEKRSAKNAVSTIENRMERKTFAIDYIKPFFEVCKDFLQHTIKPSQSLDILCRPWATVPAKDEDCLPSCFKLSRVPLPGQTEKASLFASKEIL